MRRRSRLADGLAMGPGERRTSRCLDGGRGGRWGSGGSRRGVLSLAVLLLLAAGCTREQWHRFPSPDDLVAAVSWFAVMHTGLAIQPYKMPRQPAEGAVPITGTEPALPITPQNQPALDRLVNPTQRTSLSLETGKKYYDIYCVPCHGTAGAGDGLVNAKLIIVPSLLTPRARAFSDGYIYAIVRHGRGIMPPYGEGVRGEDRWHVVNYVRQLQGAAR